MTVYPWTYTCSLSTCRSLWGWDFGNTPKPPTKWKHAFRGMNDSLTYIDMLVIGRIGYFTAGERAQVRFQLQGGLLWWGSFSSTPALISSCAFATSILLLWWAWCAIRSVPRQRSTNFVSTCTALPNGYIKMTAICSCMLLLPLLAHARMILSIGMFYFTLGNLLPKYCSKLSAAQVVAIIKTSNLCMYGMDAVLRPFVEDMKKLVWCVCVFVIS